MTISSHISDLLKELKNEKQPRTHKAFEQLLTHVPKSAESLLFLATNEPQKGYWEQLCEEIDDKIEEAQHPVVLVALEALLERWDDSIRVLPTEWIDWLLEPDNEPLARIIRTVHLNDPNEREMLSLCQTPNARYLTHLKIGYSNFDKQFWEECQKYSYLTNLKHLAFWGSNNPTMMAFIHSQQMQHLQKLELLSCTLQDEQLIQIMESPYLSKITSLDLGKLSDLNPNHITSKGLEFLARSSIALQELDLQENIDLQCHTQSKCMSLLAHHRGFNSLSTLGLAGCLKDTSPQQIRTWFRHAINFKHLKKLDLSKNHLQDEHFKQLILSDSLIKLEWLRLTNNHLTHLSLEQFVRKNKLSHLEYLEIYAQIHPQQKNILTFPAKSLQNIKKRYPSLSINTGFHALPIIETSFCS